MTAPFRAACLQVSPGNDLAANLAAIAELVEEAAGQGAALVALPEFATFLDRSSQAMRGSAGADEGCAALTALRDLARRHGILLLVGSLVMQTDEGPEGHLANRSFLIGPDGGVLASYDKIHLFDAVLADGRTVGESRHYRGGNVTPVVETAQGAIGMTICYDLRFPQLYRALALAGAEILAIPAAFTAETGAAHWEPLLRARAIETGCFVLAPATCGTHPGNWQTWGHAMIIDPWGRVLASCGDELSGLCLAEIDPAACATARSRIPSLTTNPVFDVARVTSDAT
ncbi:carbon-nitrogen hydrolase family protein [Paracoccus sp. P2]|uniref:carbon-nitrogen hydrolase family protein n=1 Tax=Paracoccus sp. P2 TaxID=3248840 RepID=UPI00391FB774